MCTPPIPIYRRVFSCNHREQSIPIHFLWFLTACAVFVCPVFAYDHPRVWNVRHIAGDSNYTGVGDNSEIGIGDTVRIWGIDGQTYEGGFTIGAANVMVMQWQGSPVRPLLRTNCLSLLRLISRQTTSRSAVSL